LDPQIDWSNIIRGIREIRDSLPGEGGKIEKNLPSGTIGNRK
jgi:hypothetical protein